MDPFSHLIPDARVFLGELAANNNRAWFTAHKNRYGADLGSRPIDLVAIGASD
ncbi:DUF2461 family protein [Sedimentitalea sp.]|uniref:DUF2461 family protein n=1 Tax=Sedimentitalea sp. TaxID=2048915 RepID=UPI00329A16AE